MTAVLLRAKTGTFLQRFIQSVNLTQLFRRLIAPYQQ